MCGEKSPHYFFYKLRLMLYTFPFYPSEGNEIVILIFTKWVHCCTLFPFLSSSKGKGPLGVAKPVVPSPFDPFPLFARLVLLTLFAILRISQNKTLPSSATGSGQVLFPAGTYRYVKTDFKKYIFDSREIHPTAADGRQRERKWESVQQ